MTTTLEDSETLAETPPCSVVVLYEDMPARDRAMALCDRLIKQFWSEVEFKLDGWRFAYLNHPGMADEAARAAAVADVIIFSVPLAGELPADVTAWVETWLGARAARPGVLIGLVGPAHDERGGKSLKHDCLRELARRAGMDYLSSVSHTGTMPDSIESVTQRAGQVTSVLEEILHRNPPPPQLRQ